MIHGRSKLHERTGEQMSGISNFRSAIEKYEESMRICRTMAIGDFNINPFDESCFSATGMHSFPYRDVVKGARNSQIKCTICSTIPHGGFLAEPERRTHHTSTKGHDFLCPDNTPNKSLYSDHLPLFCSIKEDAKNE